MGPRLLGTVSAWYAEESRGFLERKVRKVKAPNGDPAYVVEHFAFANHDLLPEDSRSGLVADGRLALFDAVGKDPSGRWVAGRVLVLRDEEEEKAVDGAPGQPVANLQGALQQAAAGKKGKRSAASAADAASPGAAAVPEGSDSKLAAKVERVADEYTNADPAERLAKAEYVCTKLDEAAALHEPGALLKPLVRAVGYLAPPQPPGGDEKEDKEARVPAQSRLRRALCEALACLAGADPAIRSAAEPTLDILRRRIAAREADTGRPLSEMIGNKSWVRIKELLGSGTPAAPEPEAGDETTPTPAKAKKAKKAKTEQE